MTMSMFKKVVVAMTVGVVSHTAIACKSVPVTTIDAVRDIAAAHGGYPLSDAQCAVLNKHHLSLLIDGQGVVLNGVNVAWAVVRIANAKMVVSDVSSGSAWVGNNVASQDNANDGFYRVLGEVISKLDWAKAVGQVSSGAE